MDKLFGTDGIRGKAGEFPLDVGSVRRIGGSLAQHLAGINGSPARIVTGRDTRESGAWIERAVHEGALDHGAVCVSAGVITTPGVAYVTGAEGFDAGVVISASHNPFEDNGIKIFTPSGKKAGGATEEAIELAVIGGRAEPSDAAAGEPLPVADEIAKDYLDHLAGSFKDLDLAGQKIVIDCANGAACELAPRLFQRFGDDVAAIHNTPDGRNINRDCGSLHLEKLQEAVAASGANIGIAFDGDADRSLFVDETGAVVDGDGVLWIMARYFHDHGLLAGKAVVATVMSNLGLEIALKSIGVPLVRTAVGDKYVLEELLESGAKLGGEQSGHIIFPEISLVGDGMLTALYLLQAITERGETLSEAANGFVRYPQVLLNVKVGRKMPFSEVPKIAAAAGEVESALEGTGRLLLRYSGTENLARVMIEGRDQEEIERLAKSLAKVIANELS